MVTRAQFGEARGCYIANGEENGGNEKKGIRHRPKREIQSTRPAYLYRESLRVVREILGKFIFGGGY